MFDQLINRREALQLIGGCITSLNVLRPASAPQPIAALEWLNDPADGDRWSCHPQLVHGPLGPTDRASVILTNLNCLLQVPLEIAEADPVLGPLVAEGPMRLPTPLWITLASQGLPSSRIVNHISHLRREWPDDWRPWPEQTPRIRPSWRIPSISHEDSDHLYEPLPRSEPCPRCSMGSANDPEYLPGCSHCRSTRASRYRIDRVHLGCGTVIQQPIDAWAIPLSVDLMVRDLQRSQPGSPLEYQIQRDTASARGESIAFRCGALRGLVMPSLGSDPGDSLLAHELLIPSEAQQARINRSLAQLDRVWSVT